MMMNKSEIVRSYREAKHKAPQIKILCQLNACDREVIENILLEAGETLVKPGRKKKEKERENVEEKREMPDAVKEALTNELIRITEAVDDLTRKAEEIRKFLSGE